MTNNLTITTRKAVVEDIATLAQEKYVFPNMGEEIAHYLLTKLEQGGYDTITDPHELALTLRLDLRSISNDQHWDVLFEAKQATMAYGDLEAEGNKDELARWQTRMKRRNFGFEKVERLPGNIGYIELHQLALPEYAGETAVAAMAFAANCDALIFDLRQNYGGEAEMVQLLISYLFSPELKHLNTIYFRPTNEHWQFWTLPHVPGKRLPEIPVYVLTSRHTFSGAEEFAYDLKYLERAILVGETTGGGGHMVDLAIVQDHFQVLFPFAGAIHPITKTSWEGTGVEPHIVVPQEQALKTAHLHALEQLIEKCKDKLIKRDLLWELEIAQSLYAPVEINDTTFSRYVGQYGQRSFALENDTLTYANQQSVSWKLVPINNTCFRLNQDIRFEFELDEQGMAAAVVISYHDDRPEIRVEKTN